MIIMVRPSYALLSLLLMSTKGGKSKDFPRLNNITNVLLYDLYMCMFLFKHLIEGEPWLRGSIGCPHQKGGDC